MREKGQRRQVTRERRLSGAREETEREKLTLAREGIIGERRTHIDPIQSSKNT